MALAIAIVLLVVVTILFHFFSPWWFTPIASNWGSIDVTVDITFVVTGIVFVAVNLFMAYAVFRYRHREDRRSHYEPENKKLEWWLTGLTAIGVIAMLAPGLFVWAKFIDVPEDADQFEVVGQQWHWSFRFPGSDGVMGTSEARYVSSANPFGISPEDPYGQDDILVMSPEVHLPLGRPVKALLRSKDVLHDFAVPQFRVKMDLVPGTVSYVWFEPIRTGTFEILCEELCGLAHHTMRGRVVIDEPQDFRSWLSRQPTHAEFTARPPGDPVMGQALYAVCATCHGPQGEGNSALNAPKLAAQEEWYLVRQLQNFKHQIRGAADGDVFGAQMAPMAGLLADRAAMVNVAAYLKTLPDQPAPATMTGDAASGKSIFTTCSACHGKQGQGIQALNAPRLAGMNDWYLATQLRNFRDGVRGSHRDDMYGAQMATMAALLSREQRINDLVAYINSL